VKASRKKKKISPPKLQKQSAGNLSCNDVKALPLAGLFCGAGGWREIVFVPVVLPDFYWQSILPA
jgi:hypothetical protein